MIMTRKAQQSVYRYMKTANYRIAFGLSALATMYGLLAFAVALDYSVEFVNDTIKQEQINDY